MQAILATARRDSARISRIFRCLARDAVNYSASTTAGVQGRRTARDRPETWKLALGIAFLAAILTAGFAAYFDPSLLLSLDNLRLCF